MYIHRIKTEEKTQVVAFLWGTEIIQFITALAVLHQNNLKKGMNLSYSSFCPGAIHPIVLVQFILFFKSSWCKIASAAKKRIKSVPKTAATTCSVFIALL